MKGVRNQKCIDERSLGDKTTSMNSMIPGTKSASMKGVRNQKCIDERGIETKSASMIMIPALNYIDQII